MPGVFRPHLRSIGPPWLHHLHPLYWKRPTLIIDRNKSRRAIIIMLTCYPLQHASGVAGRLPYLRPGVEMQRLRCHLGLSHPRLWILPLLLSLPFLPLPLFPRYLPSSLLRFSEALRLLKELPLAFRSDFQHSFFLLPSRLKVLCHQKLLVHFYNRLRLHS